MNSTRATLARRKLYLAIIVAGIVLAMLPHREKTPADVWRAVEQAAGIVGEYIVTHTKETAP